MGHVGLRIINIINILDLNANELKEIIASILAEVIYNIIYKYTNLNDIFPFIKMFRYKS